jgi:hypothetical protein
MGTLIQHRFRRIWFARHVDHDRTTPGFPRCNLCPVLAVSRTGLNSHQGKTGGNVQGHRASRGQIAPVLNTRLQDSG